MVRKKRGKPLDWKYLSISRSGRYWVLQWRNEPVALCFRTREIALMALPQLLYYKKAKAVCLQFLGTDGAIRQEHQYVFCETQEKTRCIPPPPSPPVHP